MALRALLRAGHQVCAVYTQPDRPAGRGRKVGVGPVKQLALEQGIPVQQPPTLRDTAVQDALRALDADLMVVVAYGLILPEAVLSIPRLGCINVHASLLPRWRGAAPIQRAILSGDEETGVTIMRMDAGLDTGPMLLRRPCPILDTDTAQTLHDRLAALGGTALVEAVVLLQNGGAVLTAQDERLACYARKLDKHEALLNWRQDAAQLARAVRAFNPSPMAHTTLENGQLLRIWAAQAVPDSIVAQAPGSVLEQSKSGIAVATGLGVLQLTRLQLPGGRPLSAAEFLNAHTLQGQILGATPAVQAAH